jgi:hypothetical protein
LESTASRGTPARGGLSIWIIRRGSYNLSSLRNFRRVLELGWLLR